MEDLRKVYQNILTLFNGLVASDKITSIYDIEIEFKATPDKLGDTFSYNIRIAFIDKEDNLEVLHSDKYADTATCIEEIEAKLSLRGMKSKKTKIYKKTLKGKTIKLTLEDLKQQLKEAIKEERYEDAEKLKKLINKTTWK